jgi:hypothetical protein
VDTASADDMASAGRAGASELDEFLAGLRLLLRQKVIPGEAWLEPQKTLRGDLSVLKRDAGGAGFPSHR